MQFYLAVRQNLLKNVLGKDQSFFFFFSPSFLGNIALINVLRLLSHLFKTEVKSLTDFNNTSHNQHVIQMTTLPHLWD